MKAIVKRLSLNDFGEMVFTKFGLSGDDFESSTIGSAVSGKHAEFFAFMSVL